MGYKLAEQLGSSVLLHFNENTKQWNAFLREDAKNYFNGWSSKYGKREKLLGVGVTPDAAAIDLKASMNTRDELR